MLKIYQDKADKVLCDLIICTSSLAAGMGIGYLIKLDIVTTPFPV
jgi:hypothetical protein